MGAGMKTYYQLFKLSGLEPGAEFKVALAEAERLGARVVLGDQAQHVTLQRLRNVITFADVMRYAQSALSPRPPPPELANLGIDWNDVEATVEALKTRRAVRAITRYMRDEFPAVAEAMVDERDEIMASNLALIPSGRVCGVVGMAHMDGIEARWEAAQRGGQITA